MAGSFISPIQQTDAKQWSKIPTSSWSLKTNRVGFIDFGRIRQSVSRIRFRST